MLFLPPCWNEYLYFIKTGRDYAISSVRAEFKKSRDAPASELDKLIRIASERLRLLKLSNTPGVVRSSNVVMRDNFYFRALL